MKKYFLLTITCLLLFSACSNYRQELLPKETSTNQSVDELDAEAITESASENVKYSPLPQVTEESQEILTLSNEDINNLLRNIHVDISNCRDGSQILTLNSYSPDNSIFILYIPEKLSVGKYEFFQKITPSDNIDYNDEDSVEIPVCINNSEEHRFIIKADLSFLDGETNLNIQEFILQNDEDIDFNEMYSALEYEEKDAYQMSLEPDKNLGEEELAEFLKACVYNGNMYVLDELYKIIPDDNIGDKYKFELASSIEHSANISMSEENPYKSEIFYEESCKDFFQQEILTVLTKSLQTGKSFEDLGITEIKSNYTWEEVYQIPNLKDYYSYVDKDQSVWGTYKLDLDGDGLDEILIFFPGGSMGNESWSIIHLDSSGYITDTNSGGGMRPMALYCFNDSYFFLSRIIDFNDKEFRGWEVCAFNEKDNLYSANVWYEKIGSTVVFTDKHVETDGFYFLDWDLDGYIDEYKRYEYEAIGQKAEPSEEIKKVFSQARSGNGIYGIFDINNDGIDDWTNIDKFFPSNSYPYYCSFDFVDEKTNEIIDFSNIYNKRSNTLCCIMPYQLENKNYFVFVLNGYGNYIFKLVEIQGTKPIELQSWFVSVRKRILINAYENTDNLWN